MYYFFIFVHSLLKTTFVEMHESTTSSRHPVFKILFIICLLKIENSCLKEIMIFFVFYNIHVKNLNLISLQYACFTCVLLTKTRQVLIINYNKISSSHYIATENKTCTFLRIRSNSLVMYMFMYDYNIVIWPHIRSLFIDSHYLLSMSIVVFETKL